ICHGPIFIETCLDTLIFLACMRRRNSSEGVSESPDPRHLQPPRERRARRSVAQLIQYKANIIGMPFQLIEVGLPLDRRLAGPTLAVVDDGASIRKYRYEPVVNVSNSGHNITVAG